MFRVFRSEWYDKKLKMLDKSDILRVEKFEQHLKQEPFSGKPLGYRFFREKKFDGNRLLFLVYEEHSVVFLVTITNKKAQQRDIDFIVSHLSVYKEEINKLVKSL
ncbi:MAG TPA: hypothetical protein HA230_05580 [Candidatus Aenigmarchaeota archaeon]|nr:hypothetical protein [Candidatus Aenigmarchaeota archaeon]